MFAPGLAFLALLVASVESHLGVLGPKNVSQKDAEFERTYVDEVNSELVNIYTFNHTVTRNRVREGAGLGAGGEWVRRPGQGDSASPKTTPDPLASPFSFPKAPAGQFLKLPHSHLLFDPFRSTSCSLSRTGLLPTPHPEASGSVRSGSKQEQAC